MTHLLLCLVTYVETLGLTVRGNCWENRRALTSGLQEITIMIKEVKTCKVDMGISTRDNEPGLQQQTSRENLSEHGAVKLEEQNKTRCLLGTCSVPDII
jgi:hypothetical protein